MTGPTLRSPFPAVEHCIYCGARGTQENPLTDEHVIPEGLKGDLVLSQASCKKCAALTSYFELRCQREMFPATRTMFGLHGRRRRADRIGTLPVQYKYHNGIIETRHVALSDYPFAQIMPILGTPGFFEGAVPGDSHPQVAPGTSWWYSQMPDAQARINRLGTRRRNISEIGIPAIVPLGSFYQLLAKIAHAYTYGFMVANAPPNEPRIPFFLRDIILASRDAPLTDAPYYIGCAYWADGTRVESLWTDGKAYTIKLKNFDFGERREKRVMVVHIQLFAHLNAPVYEVVVGGWL